jgi:hypothetical protein
MATHTATATRLESLPWWINSSDLPGNCPKQCAPLSHSVLVTDRLTIGPMLMCLDPGWIPLGTCAPSAARNCTLVIPPSESTDKGLKLSTLCSYEMGRKDFHGSDLMITRESQMCHPQLSHPQWLDNAPKMIYASKSDEKPGCSPLNWVGRESMDSPWMGQVNSLNLRRSCALTLNKCALATATCVTAAKDRWKICVISPMTRVCLSTPKSTLGCIPPGIHKALSLEMRLFPQ